MPDLPKSSKNGINPVAAIAIAVVSIGGFVVFITQNAINTPLTNQFEDGARQAQRDACESEKALNESRGIKTTENCD